MESDGIRRVGEHYVTDLVVPTHYCNPFSALELTTIAYNIDCDTRPLSGLDFQDYKRTNTSPGATFGGVCVSHNLTPRENRSGDRLR
jgi:hypothetical protein